MSIIDISSETNFHSDTIYTGTRLASEGAEIVKLGGALKSLGCRQQKPNAHELEQLRDAITKCQAHLDVYVVMLFSQSQPSAPEKVDEHQQDIADGVANFMAHHAKRAERV